MSKNVKFKVEKRSYPKNSAIVDIDVDDGVQEVTFGGDTCLDVDLYDVKKQFPDVKRLIIKNNIASISISNFMFPNVEDVVSYNRNYQSGKGRLVYCGAGHYKLRNMFIKHEGDKIDLRYILRIGDKALEGCMSTSFISAGNFRYIDEDAFTNYLPASFGPFTNGVLVCGNAIAGVDTKAKELVIPPKVSMSGIKSQPDVTFKKITITSETNMGAIYKFSAEVLYVDFDTIMTFTNWRNMDIKKIEVSSSNVFYTSRDGILYDKTGTILVKCPVNYYKNEVVIPEGVKKIAETAFMSCHIKSVKFPDSLDLIEDRAFFCCDELESIDFGNSIFSIGGMYSESVFSYCKSLKRITFPSQIKDIGDRAFINCINLSSVTLNEGLLFIGESAFSNNKALTEINIPATVQKLADRCLDNVRRIHISGYLPKDFFKSCIRNSEDDYNYSDDNIYDIVEITDGTYKLFIPRYIAARDIAKMDDTFYMRKFSDIVSDNKFVESILDMALYTETKQNLAISIYKYNNSSSIKTYLRRTAVNLTNRLLDSKKENELVDFLKLNIMSLPSMKKLLADDRIHQFTSAEAYLLNAISQSDDSSKTFKL